jgi:hypothetical protein
MFCAGKVAQTPQLPYLGGPNRLSESYLLIVPGIVILFCFEPHYPKAGHRRQPVGLETMLRTYFLQQWFNHQRYLKPILSVGA